MFSDLNGNQNFIIFKKNLRSLEWLDLNFLSRFTEFILENF